MVVAVIAVASLATDARADECRTFAIDEANQDSLLVLDRVNHTGYSDDGTLKWPGQKTFYKRHNGHSDDGGLFWLTGKSIVRSHKGNSDDGTMFWPNGKTLLKRHTGYPDDGSTFHANGSSWLRRHEGYSDDKSRSGSARSKYKDTRHSITARLDGDNGVRLNATIMGDGWTVVVDYQSGSDIRITECLLDSNGYLTPPSNGSVSMQPPVPRARYPRPASHHFSGRGSYKVTSSSSSVRTVDNGVERRYDSREQSSGGLPARPASREWPAYPQRRLAHSLPPSHSTTIAANYDACVEWAYKEFLKTYNSSDARVAARKECKSTDLSIARLVQPYYFKTYNGADAVKAALRDGRKGELVNRLGIIRYAMKNYFKTYNGADAARKAIKKASSLHLRSDSPRILSCLKTEFPIHFKTYDGADSMNKAFKSCSE